MPQKKSENITDSGYLVTVQNRLSVKALNSYGQTRYPKKKPQRSELSKVTDRLRFLRILLLQNRKTYKKSCAGAGITLDRNRTMVGFYNSFSDCESKTGTGFFIRNKRFEQMWQLFFRNTASVIGNREKKNRFICPRRERDLA